MLYLSKTLQVTATAALLSQVIAHPGHDLTEEIAERNAFFESAKRDLRHCDFALRKRGIEHSQQRRRLVAIEKARAARGLPQSQYKSLVLCQTRTDEISERDVMRRDPTDESHLSTLDVTPTTSGVEDIIFANSPASSHQKEKRDLTVSWSSSCKKLS